MLTQRIRWPRGSRGLVLAAAFVGVCGCFNTPWQRYDTMRHSPAPLREPPPGDAACCNCYEDSLTGGKIFEMYCSYCHNAPSLAERPFSNYQNVAAHMRVRANLTGKEYAKLVAWLRRWHDVPPPNPPVEPSPKRFEFSRPINELRPKDGKGEKAEGADQQQQALPPPKEAR